MINSRTEIEPVSEVALQKALKVLRSGGVIAFPTDTLYGLGVHPYIASAVQRVFDIKGRPKELALPLLLAEIAELEQVALEVPPLAWRLAQTFLPGALTLVLRKRPKVPDIVTGGKSTVAVRVPDYTSLRDLVRRLGAPITGTSANLSGRPGCRTAGEVADQLGGLVDLIIDGGPCRHGVESTVVDLTGPDPRVLREGAIPVAAIERVLGIALE
ncbi:MAG: threonylcarbamoyl-AMP synthase [Chloroflexi bacterium]|nr:threonylcarbamoyl-AMP synthase [Chloroflexota bacterium]